MAKKITYALQKGGVGKSTSTVATATILAEIGYRVLVVDFDPQGNATKMLTGDSIYQYTGRTIMEAIQAGDAAPYIMPINDRLDLIPAEDYLAAFSRYIYTSKVNNQTEVLKRILDPLDSKYDYIFIDIGPSLGDATINTIVYADHIIVPVDLGDLSMDALVRFVEFVDEARAQGHTSAVITGILLTMRDSRSKYEREIGETLRASYGSVVFDTEIRRRVRIKEISADGVNLAEPAMEDYYALVEEIIKRT